MVTGNHRVYMIKIIENALSESEISEVYSKITDGAFPWYLNYEAQHLKEYKGKTFEHYQFNHYLFRHEVNSPHFDYFNEIVNKLCKVTKTSGLLLRCKLNCQFPDSRSLSSNNPIHIDEHIPHTSLLLYLNDSDGDTIYFKDGKEFKRITPKRNRLVVAKGPVHHCSSNPVNTELRYVLNTVIIDK